MAINLQHIFMSILISEKNKWLSNKRRKKTCLEALPWLEHAEGYLNLVTKHL